MSQIGFRHSLISAEKIDGLYESQRFQVAISTNTFEEKQENSIKKSPVLQKLHWLPICLRPTYQTLVLTYTVLKGLAPNYLQELLKLRCPGRTLRSSSLSILDKPLSQTVTYGDQQTAGTHFPMRLRTPNHWHRSDVS